MTQSAVCLACNRMCDLRDIVVNIRMTSPAHCVRATSMVGRQWRNLFRRVTFRAVLFTFQAVRDGGRFRGIGNMAYRTCRIFVRVV